jgi:hypothetical protein
MPSGKKIFMLINSISYDKDNYWGKHGIGVDLNHDGG